MAPSVQINLSHETTEAIRSNANGKEELLIGDLMQAHDHLVSLLRNYETEREHKGQVHTFHPITSLTIDRFGFGNLTLFFPVHIFNGCKGIDADVDDKVRVTINVNVENKTALLTGEELMPEREPDDC